MSVEKSKGRFTQSCAHESRRKEDFKGQSLARASKTASNQFVWLARDTEKLSAGFNINQHKESSPCVLSLMRRFILSALL